MERGNTVTDHTGRFDRQIRFAAWGEWSQARFSQSSVLLCGCGALGSLIATLLVRAGVGAIRLVDDDVVETPNLHRQILFTQSDADRCERKVDAAARVLRRVGSATRIEPIGERIDAVSIDRLCEGVELMIDALDHWPTRFILNRTSVQRGIPWIHGAVLGATGQLAVFRPGKTICLRCLLDPNDEPPPGVAIAGVLPPVVTTIASLEAMEAMKLAGGCEDAVLTDLLTIDLWRGAWKYIPLPSPDPLCPVCRSDV